MQDCEVTRFGIVNDQVHGAHTSRGFAGADKLVMSVAGHSSALAKLGGLRLPITTMALQAMVTAPVKSWSFLPRYTPTSLRQSK